MNQSGARHPTIFGPETFSSLSLVLSRSLGRNLPTLSLAGKVPPPPSPSFSPPARLDVAAASILLYGYFRPHLAPCSPVCPSAGTVALTNRGAGRRAAYRPASGEGQQPPPAPFPSLPYRPALPCSLYFWSGSLTSPLPSAPCLLHIQT